MKMSNVPEINTKGNGSFIVVIKISIGPTSEKKLQLVVRQLEAMEAIIDARAGQKNQLYISYDSSRLGIRDIETVLDGAGVERATGYWCQLKSMWYAYLDANAKASAHSGGGACCNRPPSRYVRRGNYQ
jgi:hypothetical protein